MAEKITSFTKLNTWKQAHVLVLHVYTLLKQFPKEEQYALSDQIRRCSISISSNIAEGFSRQSSKEKIQFYFMSKGSLTELQNQLILAKDLKYIKTIEFTAVAHQTIIVGKLLTGLIKSARKA